MRKNVLQRIGISFLFLIFNLSASAQLSFTASTNNGCAPLMVTFTNTSTDPTAYRYEWNFNDGSPVFVDTLSTTVTHTFTNAGSFSVFINVYRSNNSYIGFAYSSNGNINVGGASINMADSACIGDMVMICLNGSNINWANWNFGDPASGANNTSTNYCPSHAFSSNGTYTVTLTSNGSCGTTTSTRTIVIAPNAYPHPSVMFNQSGICPGLPVNFNTGGYATYSWNFDDPASGASNTSTMQNPTHAFSGAGVFSPTVTVTNGCGNSGSAYGTANVSSNPPFPNYPSFAINANSPACPNSTINLDAPGGYNSYSWNFGDGSPVVFTSTNFTNHTYGSTPGTYNATVTITSPCGNDTTLTKAIIISTSAPFPTFGLQFHNSSPSCPNSGVDFEAPYGYNSYEWNFGDGSPVVTTTDRHTYHYYPGAITTYNASVRIVNGCGNDTTLYTTVQIMSNVGFPNESWFQLNAGPNPVCQGDQVSFEAPGGYSNYSWTFGDGNTATSSSRHTSHSYATNGTYNVSVTILNNCGNDTTISTTVVVNNSGSFPNWLEVEANPSISCPDDLIEFRVNQNGFDLYSWDFGDGVTSSSTGERIQHAYATAGTYTVTCVITNGCGSTTTVFDTVQITNSGPVDPDLSVNVQSPACPNDEIFFIVEGGQPNYTYTWNYGDASAIDTTIGAGGSHIYNTPGTYVVTTTAMNGCGSTLVLTDTVVISNTAVPSLRDEDGDRLWGFPGSGDGSGGGIPNAGCVGDAIVFYFQGSAAVNTYDFGDGTSGTAVEDFVVYGGDGAFPVTIIKHAFAANGTYLVTLTLTNGCGNSVTDTMSIHIGGDLPVDGDMTTSPAPFSTCAPIDFLAFGGSDYDWNFGDGTTLSTSSSTSSHTFASAGVYVVSVVVTNGCGNSATFSRSLNVTGVGGPAIALTSSSTPTCVNGSNGSATISVSSGEPPYLYSWNDPMGQTTATATGLAPGLYQATVTDNIGCATTLAVSINNPPAIILSVSTTTTACGAATGSATVSVTSGGTAPYTYLWSTGITNTTATGLATGGYSVVITDANSCTATAIANVSENGGATLSVNSVTNANCYGSANGAIDINVSGGTAPYTYLWSNSSTLQDPTGLAAGSYSVTVTDNSGCHAHIDVTVGQPTAINVATTVVTSPTCGNFDGKASASATGGTGPYTYLWDNNAGNQTTQTAVGLPAGTYTVTITDAIGCTSEGSVDLSNSNAPNITAVISDVSCFGGSNGAVNVTVTGGTSPYLYTWSVPPPQTNFQDVTGLTPGNYLLFVNDAHGCMSFRSYTISQPALLTTAIDNTGATCGNNDGTATAMPSGGNTSFTYAWTGGQTAQTATGLSIGNYTVTVTDNKGCTATASTSIAATTNLQEICMVTVDTGSTHNVIFWEKPAVTNLDSFRIYREDVTNVYTWIGSVHYDSLSEYHDFGADPNTTTKRYKISAVDNCGGESDMSSYHNTIYIVDNGAGQFTWNPLYTVEGGANPVDNYVLMRDDNNTNVWTQVAITAGTQNTLVDPSYASYPNGRWYVETVWGITCSPTRITVNTTRSNIKQANFTVGIAENSAMSVALYPNPANEQVTLELPAMSGDVVVTIMNSIGQLVYAQRIIPAANAKIIQQINTAAFAKGIYTVSVEAGNSRTFRKLVIN